MGLASATPSMPRRTTEFSAVWAYNPWKLAFLGQQGVETVLKRLLMNFINVDLQAVDITGVCAFHEN